MHHTKVGVDLAKHVIQVCVYKNRQVHSNTEMTPQAFALWLSNAKPCTIIFEVCATSNYWKQKALACGHDARLICSRMVKSIRQTQKTDKNDALAIIQAAQLPDVMFIPGKNKEQQQLQSIKRMRELAIKQRDAVKKKLIALLLELDIRVANRSGGIINALEAVLEEADMGCQLRFATPFTRQKYTCR